MRNTVIVACPHFDLQDLKKDVAKTVMLAAVDPEKDPSDEVKIMAARLVGV